MISVAGWSHDLTNGWRDGLVVKSCWFTRFQLNPSIRINHQSKSRYRSGNQIQNWNRDILESQKVFTIKYATVIYAKGTEKNKPAQVPPVSPIAASVKIAFSSSTIIFCANRMKWCLTSVSTSPWRFFWFWLAKPDREYQRSAMHQRFRVHWNLICATSGRSVARFQISFIKFSVWKARHVGFEIDWAWTFNRRDFVAAIIDQDRG